MASDAPGRFTPKGGVPTPAKKSDSDGSGSGSGTGEKAPAYVNSGRYTPPSHNKQDLAAMQETKPWVPYVMFGLLGIGLLMIILNYISVLPSSPSNYYLLGGLVMITLGFITATQLK
jgi:Cell division protein CrgA